MSVFTPSPLSGTASTSGPGTTLVGLGTDGTGRDHAKLLLLHTLVVVTLLLPPPHYLV